MTIVGLELTRADFERAFSRWPTLVAALVGQWVAVPLAAGVLIKVLPLPPALAAGMALVAITPIAPLSNLYVALGGGDVALAVALTAASSILTLFAAPAVAALAFGALLEQPFGIIIPVGEVVTQSVTALVLPICAGMLIRRFAEAWVNRHRLLLQRLGVLAIGALLVFVIATEVAPLPLATIALSILLAVVFTAGLICAGALVARMAAAERRDRITVAFGFPGRNLGFATLLAVAAGRSDFAAFAAVFFVVQFCALVPLALLLERRGQLTGQLA